jgi:MerR family transcriptional regulator, copper efflux regulator
MQIGEFERATGLKRSTVRVYERLGLLQSEEAANGNGYRKFTAEHVQRVGAIRLAQSLGFSLREIAALMDAWQSDHMSRAQKLAVLVARRDALELKKRQITALLRWLKHLIAWVDAGEAGEKPRMR